jgi:hypothetical protein
LSVTVPPVRFRFGKAEQTPSDPLGIALTAVSVGESLPHPERDEVTGWKFFPSPEVVDKDLPLCLDVCKSGREKVQRRQA